MHQRAIERVTVRYARGARARLTQRTTTYCQNRNNTIDSTMIVLVRELYELVLLVIAR